jgi:hypothetical protein
MPSRDARAFEIRPATESAVDADGSEVVETGRGPIPSEASADMWLDSVGLVSETSGSALAVEQTPRLDDVEAAGSDPP